jgi:adenylylsulfate kinase
MQEDAAFGRKEYIKDTAMNNNVIWHPAIVTRAERERLNDHRSACLWFEGLSGSGKSTLAVAVEERLHALGCRTFVLDGDNVRYGLCSDLGFSREDRIENIRRIGEVARLFVEAGLITLTAVISPFKADRERARAIFPEGDFVEIYCNAPLSICEQRDVKGLYKRARAGEIGDFTGISSPYEEPDHPELVLDTAYNTVEECVDIIANYLVGQGIINLGIRRAEGRLQATF